MKESCMHACMQLSEEFNVAVLITNHVVRCLPLIAFKAASKFPPFSYAPAPCTLNAMTLGMPTA